MASIGSTIEIYDSFSGPLMTYATYVDNAVIATEQMQAVMNTPVDMGYMDNVQIQFDNAADSAREFEAAMQNVSSSSFDVQSEIFSSESQGQINEMHSRLSELAQVQSAINNVARGCYILPKDTTQSIAEINNEVQRLEAAINFLETNPFSMDTEVAELQIQSITNALDELKTKQQSINDFMGGVTPRAVEIPIQWQSDNLEIFTNTGVERFQSEVESVNNMLVALNDTQSNIAQTAANTNLFPPDAVTDLSGMQSRLQAIQAKIEIIENNPINFGADAANSALEQLRSQLNQAVSAQEELNSAVNDMDIQSANEAYLRLSNTISGTERYIRDNVNEQGVFNQAIEEGADKALNLQSLLGRAFGAYLGFAGIQKAIGFIEDCTEAYDTQLDAENQLGLVLGNMLDDSYVSQFEIEVSADTTAAETALAAVLPETYSMAVDVNPQTAALEAAFNDITAKASEIQSNGIYGDEVMIAGAAEFATYFSDPEAITTMMDTLSNYAIGMEAGVTEVDTTSMVNYATNLGKIMTGSYDAMTKKGFEFSDVQKAIIEGAATEQQIIDTLGQEYINMSADMQAAAAITQVIDEGWAGLYETMSSTPRGQIVQLTNLWGDVEEMLGSRLYPAVLAFLNVITDNWDSIVNVVSAFTTVLTGAVYVVSWLAAAALNFAEFIVDNWSLISPIIYGISSALVIYAGYLAITKGIEIAGTIVKWGLVAAEYAHAAATGVAVSATTAETAAQMKLNTALYACPITWIIIAIIALIALFYAAVVAVNKFAGTSVSATGLICGVFMAQGAFIWNLFATLINFVIDAFVGLWNFIGIFGNFLGNVFTDPVAAVAHLFEDMFDFILSIIQSIASAVDTVFGFNLADAVSGFRDTCKRWTDETFGEDEIFFEQIDATEYHLNRAAYSSAWDMGYNFGESIDDKLSGLFSDYSLEDIVDKFGGDLYDMDGLGSDVGNIADNTSDIADNLTLTDEELNLLREISEREGINKFTTAEIKFDMTNHNTLNSGMDIDGFVDAIARQFSEVMAVTAEGVHA